MKKHFVIALLMFSLVYGNIEAQPAIQLNFDFSKLEMPISSDLYGIFFEDINYAADGGSII